MNGYLGKMLFVDLSAGTIEEKPLEEQTARMFLGGPALGAKVLFDNMPANADPFGKDSMLGFVSGPLNDTSAFLRSR